MDRLLTPNEQPNIPQDTFSIYDWKTALQIKSYINDVKKLQGSKTASLVAQEIFNELEEYFGLHESDDEGKDILVKLVVNEGVVMNYDNKSMNQLNIYKAIKSKWGIE